MSTQDQVTNLLQTMENLEADLAKGIEQTDRKAQRIDRIIYTIIAVIGAMSLINIYFVNDLTQEVRLVVRNMSEMQGHFDQVSTLMLRMRGTINNMDQNMRLMPIMGEQMAEIGNYTGMMKRDVDQVNTTIANLDHQIGSMNASVWDMSMRFRNVNVTVGNMGQDVNQFARPVP